MLKLKNGYSIFQNSGDIAFLLAVVYAIKGFFWQHWIDVPLIIALFSFARFPPPRVSQDRMKALEDRLANHDAIITNLALKMGISPPPKQ